MDLFPYKYAYKPYVIQFRLKFTFDFIINNNKYFQRDYIYNGIVFLEDRWPTREAFFHIKASAFPVLYYIMYIWDT